MKARLLLRHKFTDEEGDLVEMVVWGVPVSHLCLEGVRYRLAFIPKEVGEPVVLYDNHHPKGHHKHLEELEQPYSFSDIDHLLSDFEADINFWKKRRRPFE